MNFVEKGPKGEVGPRGLQGKQGPAGPTGEIGPTGPGFSQTDPLLYLSAGVEGGSVGKEVHLGENIAILTETPELLHLSLQRGKPNLKIDVINNYSPETENWLNGASNGRIHSHIGSTFRNKAVYRQYFDFTVTIAAASQHMSSLAKAKFIVQAGGCWDIGNGTLVPIAMHGKVGITAESTLAIVDGNLVFLSTSEKSRTNTPVYLWVDYTKD